MMTFGKILMIWASSVSCWWLDAVARSRWRSISSKATLCSPDWQRETNALHDWRFDSSLLVVSVWHGSSVYILERWCDLVDPMQTLLRARSYWPWDYWTIPHGPGREKISSVCLTCEQTNLTRMVFISSTGKLSFNDVITYAKNRHETWPMESDREIYFDLFVGDRCDRFNRWQSVWDESGC